MRAAQTAGSPLPLSRRSLLAAPALLVGGGPALAQAAPRPFDYDDVRARAADLARAPHQPPQSNLPPEWRALGYDQYQEIRFRRERSIPLGGSGFSLQAFHPGFLFARTVGLNRVSADGAVSHIPYAADLFEFGKNAVPPVAADLGFAGFKVLYPLNEPDKRDEVIAFLGASYFRFLGRGQRYGLSARGLAVGSGDPQEPEEFPFFRDFWIVEPSSHPGRLTILALLDSPSGTGAYEFTVTPGDQTTVDVRATLYARGEWRRIGLAPLTSMFHSRVGPRLDRDEFRPQVHDSDTLAARSEGRRLARALDNPAEVRLSDFGGDVRAFGLLQRERRFEAYQDLEANYHLRPSYWVEAGERWPEGSLKLVELPTQSEAEDNIVAFWRPARPIPAGGGAEWFYRLTALGADATPALGRFAGFAAGRADEDGQAWLWRSVWLDFGGGDLLYAARDIGRLELATEGSSGQVSVARLTPHPGIGGVRAVVDVRGPRPGPLVVRAELRRGGRALTETAEFVLRPRG